MEHDLSVEPLKDDTAYVLVCLRCAALLGEFSQFPDTQKLRTLIFTLTGSHEKSNGCPQESAVVQSCEPYSVTSTRAVDLYMTRRN
jgi:hypothetical protein